jgi:predicted enzyme related to lactoylglutathione lyase
MRAQRVQFVRMRRWMPRGLAIVLICCLLAPAAAFAEPAFDVPPIGGTGSTEHHPGKVVWVDLVTPNLAGAEHFYSSMFGWTFQQIRPDYAVALLAGRPLGGILQRAVPTGQKRQPGWLTFIAVPDLEAAARSRSHTARKVSRRRRATRAAAAKRYSRTRRAPCSRCSPRPQGTRGTICRRPASGSGARCSRAIRREARTSTRLSSATRSSSCPATTGRSM